MSGPAYTPGPWLARIPHCVRSAKGGVGLLFVPSNEETTREEDIANIQLAAAAPEMYELLRDIRELINPDRDGLFDTELLDWQPVDDRLTAIISKAEGK